MAAIKDCCDEFSEYQGLTVEFRHQGFPAALPKDVALCVFRVAQESLHNVVKHSGATEALVVLEKSDDAVKLSVSDQGGGFDPESARVNGGLGLISMRERLRLVGGEIFISSQVSQGTQVNVTIPLK
jgi:signal transduction histidine kinase